VEHFDEERLTRPSFDCSRYDKEQTERLIDDTLSLSSETAEGRSKLFYRCSVVLLFLPELAHLHPINSKADKLELVDASDVLSSLVVDDEDL
jgi:hypothetical protein